MNEHVIDYHKYLRQVSELVSIKTEKLLISYITLLESKLYG